MTDLKLLTVSLTKEGAHKIFYLLRDLSVSEVLKSSNNVLEGVNLDQGLVRNILSAEPDDTLPNIWQRAKDHGETTVKSLLFLAIVFSHYQLIAAFRMGSLGQGQGEISRNDVRNIKVFTNIRREAVKLGLADYSADSFCYNMMQMFENANLGELTEQLLRHKLLKAGWDGTNSTADEAVRNGFHEVLAVDEMTFRLWLDGNSVGINLPDPEKELIRKFNFSSGHKPAKEGKANRGLTAEPVEANLTHNMLQTKLFTYLSGEFGPENVGTEVPSGVGGNSIDVVMVAGEDTTFYELKTRASVRLCIREALPQLLEYCYWPSENRSNRLVIVGEAQMTEDATDYLEKLRRDFGLPIYYAQINREDGQLSGLS